MKKWLLGLGLGLLMILSSIYLFIPQTIHISREVAVSANQQRVFRFLSDEHNWQKWWPGNTQPKNGHFSYKDKRFEIKKQLHNGFEITISKAGWTANSLLQIVSYSIDSIGLSWSAELGTGINPIEKVRLHFAVRSLEANIQTLLQQLTSFVGDMKNLDGLEIKIKQTEKYLSTTQRKMIAIPFQLLLTDRRKEPDTTKWLTRIYYPVI